MLSSTLSYHKHNNNDNSYTCSNDNDNNNDNNDSDNNNDNNVVYPEKPYQQQPFFLKALQLLLPQQLPCTGKCGLLSCPKDVSAGLRLEPSTLGLSE